MLIHSVTPAHMLTPQTDLPQFTSMQVGNNVLEGLETPQGFQVARIHSTDPSIYLRKNLSPGSFYKA